MAKEELHKQLGNSVPPDYEAVRDRTLTKLRMGRQSPAGKAIQAFIKELRHVETDIGSRQTVTTTGEQKPPLREAHREKANTTITTAASLVREAYERYKQGKFVHTDVYENALFEIATKCGLKMFRDIKGKKFYITPQDNWGEKLVTSSSIGGMVEFLSTQPLLKPFSET